MAAALWALLAALAGPVPGPGPAGAAQVPQVPLLVWSTERALWAPLAAPAGRVLAEPELRQLLEPGLQRGPRTVLLFLQDQPGGFHRFWGRFGKEPSGAFPRLQGALGSAGSALTLPAVAGAAAARAAADPAEGPGRPSPPAPARGGPGGAQVEPLRPESDPGEPTLLLVGLPHSRSGLMGAKEALASNDAVLGEVLQVLQEEQVPYTALFTARRAHDSRGPGGLPGAFGGPRRGLLGVAGGEGPEPPPPLRWPPRGEPRMLLWARNVSLALRGRQRDLTPQTFGAAATVELGGSSWSPREARFVLQYKEVFGETLNITFLLRRSWFPVSGRSWAWLEEIGVTLGGAPPARFRVRGAAAPSPLGWRCGDLGTPGPLLLPLPPLEHSQHWGLRIRDLQVQGFNVSGGVFGAASDCAAFFGPGAWMGLISGGLLLGGLLLGGGILLGLRPMDRFDDPRGPPLPVPLGD